MTSPALQEILALLGCPAAGNPAQYLFERAITAAGLDWRFLSVDVAADRLAEAIAGIDAMGFRGCVLSGPLEQLALPTLGNVSPAARFAGAVSLIERKADGLFGHMTAGRGVVEALRAHAELSGGRLLVAGAGPTGRSAALELALAGVAEIVVTDRSPEAAVALVEALRDLATEVEIALLPHESPLEIPKRLGIVVSSRLEDQPRSQFTGLRSELVVADTELVEQPSGLVAAAQKAGCLVIDGLEVYVEKTAIDFQVLTGTAPDPDMLREALEEFLSA